MRFYGNKNPRHLIGGGFYLITYVTPSYDDDALEQLLLLSYDDDALVQLLLLFYDALQPRISPIKVVRSVTEPVSWISLTLNWQTFH
jgi:hypothetical protein